MPPVGVDAGTIELRFIPSGLKQLSRLSTSREKQ